MLEKLRYSSFIWSEWIEAEDATYDHPESVLRMGVVLATCQGALPGQRPKHQNPSVCARDQVKAARSRGFL